MTDITNILSGLNDRQREAVTAPPGPLLVLAGAGTGKTSVLTRRIAWLVHAENTMPFRVMAVTFTNKAAREMRFRIEDLLGYGVERLYIGTFHGLSHRFLRYHWQEAGLVEKFEIIDTQDQLRTIKDLMKSMKVSLDEIDAKYVQYRINHWKDVKVRASNVQVNSRTDEFTVEIYRQYEMTCQKRGLVDFSELLLRTVELLKNNQVVREQYQERFQHVLVDEFQDINAIQHDWLRLFTGPHENITAVGDEDQSIYGWRGAHADNMKLFQKEYSGTRLIRLEQNYRSTEVILKAANSLIENNSNRIGKTLRTDQGIGHQIRMIRSYDDSREAEDVAKSVTQCAENGFRHSDIAILFRTNAQSRVIEQVFGKHRIPFFVYGGLRFYARSEIKDVLAYLRLIVDRHSNQAFSRVINMPPRGIGQKTQEDIVAVAERDGISYWNAATKLANERASRPVKAFVELIEKLDKETTAASLSKTIEYIIEQSGLRAYLKKNPSETNISRLENLDEMINAGKDYADNIQLERDENEVLNYLDAVTLDAGDRHGDSATHAVQLMTLHSAKGLEFPVVFMVGMNENLMPHFNSREKKEQLEEERRLMYVGMTRTIQQLYLVYTTFRYVKGSPMPAKPSRFLSEIPSEYRIQDGFESEELLQTAEQSDQSEQIRAGRRVSHSTFGNGTVTYVDLQGKHSTAEVYFDTVGRKLLLLEKANLQLV